MYRVWYSYLWFEASSGDLGMDLQRIRGLCCVCLAVPGFRSQVQVSDGRRRGDFSFSQVTLTAVL